MKKVLLLLSILVLCGACEAGENSSSSNTTSGGSSGGNLGEVSFNIANATALILQEETSTSQSLALTSSEAVTNLQVLANDGTIQAAVTLDSGGTQEIIISKIDIAPTGEAYFLFQGSVTVDGTACSWVLVNTDNSASCVDTEVGETEALGQVSFNSSGDVFYGIATGSSSISALTSTNEGDETLIAAEEVKKRKRTSATITTLLDAERINLTVWYFLQTEDTFFLRGTLEGTDRNFFQFTPTSEGRGSLEEPCLYTIASDSLQYGFLISREGLLYVIGSGDACNSSGEIYRGILSAGELTLTAMDLGDIDRLGERLIEDSQGNVYTVDLDSGTLVLVAEGAFEEISVSSIDIVEESKIKGDFFYLAGTNDAAQRVLIRKNLLGDREETDLLGGQNLLVQQFDVAENGDVYIGALDLDTTTVKLLKYVNATGALEEIDSLPSDVQQIILL